MEHLGVNKWTVSWDERNEYHGITVELAMRILDAMGRAEGGPDA